MVLKLHEQRKVAFVIDLHGHSNQLNAFTYGNIDPEHSFLNKVFPLTLCKTSDVFNYNYCSYSMHKSKKGTARLSLFSELNQIPNIFTIETSFAGWKNVKYLYKFRMI